MAKRATTKRTQKPKAMEAPIAEIVNTDAAPPAPVTKEGPADLGDADPTPTADPVPADPLEARLYWAKKHGKDALAAQIQGQLDQRAEDASKK